MADAILGEDELARNDQSASIPSPATDLPEHWFELAGIVDDPLLDPDAQVAILARIDETGSAPLGDLAALLDGYAKPVKSVLQLVRRGILAIEPGLIDANSLVSRRVDPPRRKATETPGGDGQGQGVVRFPAAGELRRLDPHRPQPEVFLAAWTDRGLFRREPMLERPGIYLALFSNCAYVGMSAALSGRLVASNHLLEHGVPDLVIAAVDRNNLLSEEQARVAERLLAREVERHGRLRLANNKMPVGGHVDMVGFGQVERFVRDVVRCLRDAGLAFAGPVDRPRSPEPVRECAEALLAERVYSTTGGQMVVTRRSEATVAQPVSEIVTITRTASCRFQHPTLDVIGLLRSFKAFGEAASTLAGAPECQQEQKHCERDGSVAQRRPHPWARGDPGEEPADHRRPRFQSSSRA